jgi:carboxylesterase type B
MPEISLQFFISGRNADDEHLADVRTDYWTQFVKTGSPSRADQAKWPPYLSGSEVCMDLGRVAKARLVEMALPEKQLADGIC